MISSMPDVQPNTGVAFGNCLSQSPQQCISSSNFPSPSRLDYTAVVIPQMQRLQLCSQRTMACKRSAALASS